MPNKKRKSGDRKSTSKKTSKEDKKDERKRDESKSRSDKGSSKTGHQRDDYQSRRLSGVAHSEKGRPKSKDRSESRHRRPDSDRGAPTHSRSSDYYPREGPRRDTSTSRKRDTPPSTGAQSAIFTAEATAQAATIAASLSDVELFKMDVFNPLRDINADISPVEPCQSLEELYMQTEAIEAYARQEEKRDSFPAANLRTMVEVRVKKSQAQDKVRFRAIYFCLLTQLYTRYFARRLAIKSQMAQSQATSQEAAQVYAESTIQSQAAAATHGRLTTIPPAASSSVDVANMSQLELSIVLQELESEGPYTEPKLLEQYVLGTEQEGSTTLSTTGSLTSAFGKQTLEAEVLQEETVTERPTIGSSPVEPESETIADISRESNESMDYKRLKTATADPDALEIHAEGGLDAETDKRMECEEGGRTITPKVSTDTEISDQQQILHKVSTDTAGPAAAQRMETEEIASPASPEPEGGPILVQFNNNFYTGTAVRSTNMRCGIDYAAILDTNVDLNKIRNNREYYKTRKIVPTPVAYRPGMRVLRERFIEVLLDSATQQLIQSATSAETFALHEKEDFFYVNGRERFPAAAALAELAHYGFVVKPAINVAVTLKLGSTDDFALTSAWIRLWDMALICFRAMLPMEDVLCLFEDHEFLYFPEMLSYRDYQTLHAEFVYFLRYKHHVYLGRADQKKELAQLQYRQLDQVRKGLDGKWRIDLSNVPIGARTYINNPTLSYQPPIPTMFIGQIPEAERSAGKRRGKKEVSKTADLPAKPSIRSVVQKPGTEMQVTVEQQAGVEPPTIRPHRFGEFTDELMQVFSPWDLTRPIYRAYVCAELSSSEVDKQVSPPYNVYQRLMADLPREIKLFVQDCRRLKGREFTIREFLELVVKTVQCYGRDNDFEPMLRLVQVWNVVLGQLDQEERRQATALPMGNEFGALMGVALEFYNNQTKGHPDVRVAEPFHKLYYRQLGDYLRSYLIGMVTLQWPRPGDRIPHPESWNSVWELLERQAERDRACDPTPRGENPLDISTIEEVSDVQIIDRREETEKPRSELSKGGKEGMSQSLGSEMLPPQSDARGRPTGQKFTPTSGVHARLTPLGHGRISEGAMYFYGRGRTSSRSGSRSSGGLSSDQIDRRLYDGDYHHSPGIYPNRQMSRGDYRDAYYLGKKYVKTIPPRPYASRSGSQSSSRSSVRGREAGGPDKPPTLEEQRRLRLEAQPDISGVKLGLRPHRQGTRVTFEDNWRKGEEAIKLFEWAAQDCYVSAFNRRGDMAEDRRVRIIAGKACDDLSREQSWIREQLPTGKPLEDPDRKLKSFSMTPLVPKAMEEEPQYKTKWTFNSKDLHNYTRECAETMYFLKYMYHPFSDPRVTIIDTDRALEGLHNRIADMATLYGDSRDYPIIIGFDMEDFSCPRDPNLHHSAMHYGWQGYRPSTWDIEAGGNMRNTTAYDKAWTKEYTQALAGENCLNWPPEQRKICPIIYQRCTRLHYGRVIQLYTHDQQQYLIDLFKFYENTVTDLDKIFLRKDTHGRPCQPSEYIPAADRTPGILDASCISYPKNELLGLLTGEKIRRKGGLGIIYVTHNADADFDRLQSTLGIIASRAPIREVRPMQEKGMSVLCFVDNDELALACGMQEEWTPEPAEGQGPQYKKKWSPSALALYAFRANRHVVRLPAEFERQYGLLPIPTRNFDRRRTIVEYKQGRPEMKPQECERPEFHPHRLMYNKGDLAKYLNIASLVDIEILVLNYVQADAQMTFAATNGLLLLRSPMYSPEDSSVAPSDELRKNMWLCSEVIRGYFSYPVFFADRKPDMLTNRQKPKYWQWIKVIKEHVKDAGFTEWRLFRDNNYKIWPDLWYKHFSFLVNEIEKHCTSPTCPEEELFLRQVCIVSFIEMWQGKMQLHLRRRIEGALCYGEGVPKVWRPFPDRRLTYVPPMNYRWMEEVRRLKPLPGPPLARTRDLEMRAIAARGLNVPILEAEQEQDESHPAATAEVRMRSASNTTEESERTGEEESEETYSLTFPGQGTDQHEKCESFWKASTRSYTLAAHPARTIQEVEQRIWSLVKKFEEAEQANMDDREELYGLTLTSDLASRAHLAQYKIWKHGSGLLTALMPNGEKMVETFILPTVLEQSRPNMSPENRQKYAKIWMRLFTMDVGSTDPYNIRAWYLKEMRVISKTVQVQVLGACYEDFADFQIAQHHRWVGPAVERMEEPYPRDIDHAAYWLK